MSATLPETTPARMEPARLATTTGFGAWLKANLFNSWLSTAMTLALLYIIIRSVLAFVDWAFVHAVWQVPYSAQGIADTRYVQIPSGLENGAEVARMRPLEFEGEIPIPVAAPIVKKTKSREPADGFPSGVPPPPRPNKSGGGGKPPRAS